MRFAKDKLEWLEFDLLKNFSEVTHGVFLRHGGTSEHHFASLNLSDSVGDHPDSVKTNRELVQESLGLNTLIFPNQTHGVNVVEVDAKNKSNIHHCDALFTLEKNVGLAITHADCQAALFYDPDHQAIGAAHAGWKGSVQNVYKALVDQMQEKIKTKPSHLIVCISPSLGPDHAEFKDGLPEQFMNYQVKPDHFDFWQISVEQLTALGIPKKNIELSRLCTFCEEKDCYSHRREKKTGRHATIIGLK